VSNVVAGRDTESIGDLRAGEWQIRMVEDSRLGGAAVPELFIGCASKGLCWHPIAPSIPNSNGAVWSWDGNREQPSLSPSIYCQQEKGGCGFHGHLSSGVLR
jgi:Family of unknown function (DUF6527)